jgi:hypothetical protein
MGDKEDAARVAWATIKLSQVGRSAWTSSPPTSDCQWRKRRGCCG